MRGRVEEPLRLEEVLARREFRLELRLKLFHQRHALFEHDGGQPGPLGFQAFKHIGAIHREILHLLDGYLGEVLSRILKSVVDRLHLLLKLRPHVSNSVRVFHLLLVHRDAEELSRAIPFLEVQVV